VSEQKESKEEERGDVRVEEASSPDRRKNRLGGGSEERAVAERVEGERVLRFLREVTM